MKLTNEEIGYFRAGIDRALAGGRLNARQRRFLAETQRRLDRYGTGTRLSDKQAAWLRKIIERGKLSGRIVDWREARKRHRGASPWPSGQGRRWLPLATLALAGGLLGAAIAGAAMFLPTLSGPCWIKGNISVRGERIYHMPWQRYYFATRINERRGERWFCSEQDARSAGWRRSKV